MAPSKRRRLNQRTMAPYLFVLPNMLIFGIFVIWPAINGFNLSFYDSSDGLTFTYVGTQNYTDILSDAQFWDVVRNTVVYTVGFVLLSLVIGTVLALMLNSQRKGRGGISAAYFLPPTFSSSSTICEIPAADSLRIVASAESRGASGEPRSMVTNRAPESAWKSRRATASW